MSSECKEFHNFTVNGPYKVGVCKVCGVGKIYFLPNRIYVKTDHNPEGCNKS